MNRLRVFTAFSGYDSQCLALNRLRETHGVYYELVGISEIDKDAIKAHNALFPDAADKNFGDISKIDWSSVPDFDLFTYSSPCQDFSTAGLQRGGGGRKWHTLLAPLGMPSGDSSKETVVSPPRKCQGSHLGKVLTAPSEVVCRAQRLRIYQSLCSPQC